MIWIWLGVVISLLLIEYLSRNFSAICFAFSGIISCIMTKFTGNYMHQLGVFLIVGIILIVVVRPFLLKVIYRKYNISIGEAGIKEESTKNNSKKKVNEKKTKKKK
jgi:Membrane protein implicated in regulation of membrane protease activity